MLVLKKITYSAKFNKIDFREQIKMKLNKENLDAIIIGSGIGGLATASQLAAKGAQY